MSRKKNYTDMTPGQVPFITTAWNQLKQSESNERQAELKNANALNSMLARNQKAVDAIKECIHDGITQKTALIERGAGTQRACHNQKIYNALAEHTGPKVDEYQFWHVERSDNNAHVYAINWGAE